MSGFHKGKQREIQADAGFAIRKASMRDSKASVNPAVDPEPSSGASKIDSCDGSELVAVPGSTSMTKRWKRLGSQTMEVVPAN